MRSDRWSDDELLVACDIYLRKGVTYDNRVRLAVLETGRSIASVKMRFGNFDFCNDPNRGLKFRNDGGEWVFRAQTEKEKEVLRALDLMPQLPPKRGPGRPRKNPRSGR